MTQTIVKHSPLCELYLAFAFQPFDNPLVLICQPKKCPQPTNINLSMNLGNHIHFGLLDSQTPWVNHVAQILHLGLEKPKFSWV